MLGLRVHRGLLAEVRIVRDGIARIAVRVLVRMLVRVRTQLDVVVKRAWHVSFFFCPKHNQDMMITFLL